ncbi:MAG: hypothetical protein ABI443_02380 [Chthoniobacterales bacterium]
MKNFLCIAFLATAFCARAYSQADAKPAPSASDAAPAVASPSVAIPSASPESSAPVQPAATAESSPAAAAVSPASANSPQPAAATETSAPLIPPGNAAASIDPNSETGNAAISSEPIKVPSLTSDPGSTGETAAPADAPLPTGPSDSSEAPAAQGPKKTDAAMPDSAFTEPNSFVPEETKAAEIPAATATKENEAEKLRLDRLHYRKAKTEALKNADIRSLQSQAEKATTDANRRAAYRKYYELLNKKISELDPSTTEYTKNMFNAQLDRLKEDRIEPTIPLNPPPTPEPLH